MKMDKDFYVKELEMRLELKDALYYSVKSSADLLLATVLELEKVLSFYADEDNYDFEEDMGGDEYSAIDVDKGKQAREILLRRFQMNYNNKAISQIIDSEIKWSTEHIYDVFPSSSHFDPEDKSNLSVWREGFIAGLEQAKRLFTIPKRSKYVGLTPNNEVVGEEIVD